MGEIVQEQVKRATTEIILADIIDFSLLSAEKQYAAVRNMTGLLDSRLRLMSGLAFWRLDEIVLSFVPTGDGFYILLQPLAAGYGLFLAISLRSSILTGMEPPDLLKGVRFAVHVGECFAFRDITGKENWIGPGLNECARLISAKPEQSPNEGIPADQSFIIVSEREYAYFRQRFRETPGMARFLDSLKVKLSDEFDFVDKHGIKHTARFVESSRHVAVNPPAPPDLEERRRKFVEEQIQKQGR